MQIIKINLDICKANAGIKTDTELSKKIGVSRTTLASYRTVTGLSRITLKKLMHICTVLNCKIDDLVEFKYV